MQPFALLHRDGADHVEVLTGDVLAVPTLAAVPFEPGRPTLAVIPYRQISERGFACVDDGEFISPTEHKSTPILRADGHLDAERVKTLFLDASADVPTPLRAFVIEKLKGYQHE